MEFVAIEKTSEELERLWEWTEKLEHCASREAFEQFFNPPNTLLWSMELEGERIGHLSLTGVIEDHSASFHLLIYDRHPLRYVREVRAHLDEVVSELGLKLLVCCFWTGYHSTPKLLKRLGFRHLGIVPSLLYAGDGSSLDAHVVYRTGVGHKGVAERIREWVVQLSGKGFWVQLVLGMRRALPL